MKISDLIRFVLKSYLSEVVGSKRGRQGEEGIGTTYDVERGVLSLKVWI